MTSNMIKTDETEELIQSLDLVAGRRAFIKALGFGAVGAAVFGAAEGLAIPAVAAAAINDLDILNFALNLEYLEATFYSFAYNGKDIPAALTVGGDKTPGRPITSTGRKVKFTSNLIKAYADEIANEELRHVEFLRAALGGAAVSRPALNIGSAFQEAATQAGIAGTFDAYANDTSFLLASYIFEDVGVTAYHGAASLIQNPAYLSAAAGILAVEAYHAGIIRTSLFAADVAAANTNNQTTTAQISALRSMLANNHVALVDDVGIGPQGDGVPRLADVDAPNATMFQDLAGAGTAAGDAIAYSRNPTQVLNIVYGAYDTRPGLFFPEGMNGKIAGNKGIVARY